MGAFSVSGGTQLRHPHLGLAPGPANAGPMLVRKHPFGRSLRSLCQTDVLD
jgi:hypothetical protein